jgi:hypothetical protein
MNRLILLFYVFFNGIFYREFAYLGLPLGEGAVYIAEIVLAVVTGGWICNSFLSGHSGFKRILAVRLRPLWFFLMWAVVVLAWSSYLDPLFTVRELASVYYALFLVLIIALSGKGCLFQSLAQILVISAALSLLLIFYRYLTGQGGGETTTEGILRYGNYEVVGLLFLVTWSLTRPFNSKNLETWVRLLLLAISIWAIVFLIQHRSATIALVVALGMVLVHRSRGRRGTLVTAITVLAGLIAIYFFLGGGLAEGTLSRLGSIMTPSGDANSSWRMVVWLHAISSMNPLQLLIGVGWGMKIPVLAFGERVYGESDHFGMHNSFAFYFYHLGAVGLTLFAWLIARSYRRALQASKLFSDQRESNEIVAVLAANLGILVFAFYNVVLEGPYMGSVFWVTLGMLWLKIQETTVKGLATLTTAARL